MEMNAKKKCTILIYFCLWRLTFLKISPTTGQLCNLFKSYLLIYNQFFLFITVNKNYQAILFDANYFEKLSKIKKEKLSKKKKTVCACKDNTAI